MPRKNPSDRHTDENAVSHDSPRQGGDGQADSPDASIAPGEPIVQNKTLLQILKSACATLCQQVGQVKAALTDVSRQSQQFESYTQILAACQREAADFANHTIERHALYPAIEAVDLLSSLIYQLNEQAASLAGDQTHCPLLGPLINSIAEAAKIAQVKRECLDMKAIRPQPLDDLDVREHDIKQVVPTDDPGKHKRIERTLIPGLLYRGAVLRQARVSIYCHAEKHDA